MRARTRDHLGAEAHPSPRGKIVLIAAVAGAVIALCWLPLGFAPLAPAAFLLALRGLRKVDSAREALVFGGTYGIARYAVASHFLLSLLRYSALAIVFYLLAILFILPFGLLEGWGAFRLEKALGLPRAVGFAILFSVGEWLRSLGDLSLPADLLAHGFGSSPAWLFFSSVTGPYGFTAFAIAVAVLADLAIAERARPAGAAFAGVAAVALWALPPAADALAPPRTDDGADLRIAIVQPVVAIEDKLSRDRWPALRERLEKLTLEAASGSDLIVWPETARAGPLIWKDPAPFHDAEMEELATKAGVPILYGCEIARLHDGHVRALYNGAALVRPGGRADWYGKQHLLPFVEGIPFASVIGWDPAERARKSGGRKSILSLLGNFVPGPEPTIFEVGPARLGVLICFEGMYPSLARRYRRAGANALVVLTNDAWWGESVFPSWHARMAATRARELDVPVIRAANSGVSSVIDRFGRSHGETGLGRTAILRQTVHTGPPGTTFYAQHGDLPAALVAFALAIGIACRELLSWRRRAGVRVGGLEPIRR